MPSVDTLTDRIRAEFADLPGLKITFAQACRLWHANEARCLEALESLVREGFLRRIASGAFIALPRPQGRSLRIDPETPYSLRCPHCQHLNPNAELPGGRHAPLSYRCLACSRLVTHARASA